MADNIYRKMASITGEIATVAKNLSVGFGKGSYKAVSEADVLAAVKPIEIKYGVYSYPYSRKVIDTGEIVTNYNGTEKRQNYMRVETIYRFVNVDAPDEYIDITTYGDGVDSQDKAPGKAMTYGDKYALLKAYKIQTGEDPDQEASEPLVSKTQKSQTISVGKARAIEKRAERLGVNIPKLLEQYGVTSFTQLTEEAHDRLHSTLLRYETQQ